MKLKCSECESNVVQILLSTDGIGRINRPPYVGVPGPSTGLPPL